MGHTVNEDEIEFVRAIMAALTGVVAMNEPPSPLGSETLQVLIVVGTRSWTGGRMRLNLISLSASVTNARGR